MKRNIIMMVATVIAAFTMTGCTMTKMGVAYMGFPSEAQDAYAEMMGNLSETGDPAQAMMKEWLITDEDLTEDDIFDEMKSLAGDFNMRFVGEKPMFRIKDPKPNQVSRARIGEFCSLGVAKKMLDHSRFYGGFMPCRVIYVEYGDGRRYLVSMDMTLALYGGTDKKPIDPALMEDMKNIMNAMEKIPLKAAGYDQQIDADKAMIKYYTEKGINERLPTIKK
ncbi:DUF302 domain-containing protein [Sulfurimonas sp.]|uniref:DUF302 domain-containing protein n=1 Tax=Sulfurimonas sp. TaxID=2022749 RepID=UPI0035616914